MTVGCTGIDAVDDSGGHCGTIAAKYLTGVQFRGTEQVALIPLFIEHWLRITLK